MDLKHLQRFTVLARELHYSRSADVLGEAQSTLSQQIVALETALGVRLFERTKHRVQLTNAGNVFLEDVAPIVAQLELAADRAREAADGKRGLLLVGASSPTISSRLPVVARAFGAAYPDVALKIRIMYSKDLVEELERSRIHVAFGRAGLKAEHIESELLWRQPFRIVLPSTHAGARARSVPLRNLSGETLITYPRALVGESYDELIAFCRAQDFVPKAIEEVSSAETMLGLVACGLGVAILARHGAAHGADTVTKPIAGSIGWTFSTAAYWRTGESSPLVRAFLDAAHRAPKN